MADFEEHVKSTAPSVGVLERPVASRRKKSASQSGLEFAGGKVAIVYLPEREVKHLVLQGDTANEPLRTLSICNPNAGRQVVLNQLGQPVEVDSFAPITVTLLPGVNFIDWAHWLKIRDHYDIQLRLTNSKWLSIRVVMPSILPKGEEATGTLSEYSVSDAVDLIESCYDKEAMKRWAVSDQRKAVRSALAARLQALADRSNRGDYSDF